MTVQEIDIKAFDVEQEVHGIDEEGNTVVLGQLIHRDYEQIDGHARRYAFRSGDRVYSIGVTSSGQVSLLDPQQVASPFLEAGLEPEVVKYSRGGTRAYMLLADQDHAFSYSGLEVFPAVGIWHQIQPGKASRIELGYFRVVCANGLFGSVLSLGSWSFSHRHAEEFTRVRSQALEGLQGLLSGDSYQDDEYPHANGIPFLIKLLRLESDDPADTAYPSLVRDAIGQLHRTLRPPERARLADELAELHGTVGMITVLQFLNAVTNVGLHWGPGQRPMRWYWRYPRLLQAIDQLTALGSWAVGLAR